MLTAGEKSAIAALAQAAGFGATSARFDKLCAADHAWHAFADSTSDAGYELCGGHIFRLRPLTGRTHQLRVHMNALGAPIVDDPWYPVVNDVAAEDFSAPLQLLAHTLEFDHPVSGERRQFVSGRSLKGDRDCPPGSAGGGVAARRPRSTRGKRADVIVLDLEDAVAPGSKESRGHVDHWLRFVGQRIVRVNAPGTSWYADAVEVVAAHGCAVMLPKCEVEHETCALTENAGRCAVVLLLETASGILSARSLCAEPGVVRASFGSYDLAAELGSIRKTGRHCCTPAVLLFLPVRAQASMPPSTESLPNNFADPTILRAASETARSIGFTGKLCIHPSQPALVNTAFSPMNAELEWARRVMSAVTGTGVTVLDGKMVAAPVLSRARRILDRVSDASWSGRFMASRSRR